jgi:hypothetical protein
VRKAHDGPRKRRNSTKGGTGIPVLASGSCIHLNSFLRHESWAGGRKTCEGDIVHGSWRERWQRARTESGRDVWPQRLLQTHAGLLIRVAISSHLGSKIHSIYNILQQVIHDTSLLKNVVQSKGRHGRPYKQRYFTCSLCITWDWNWALVVDPCTRLI